MGSIQGSKRQRTRQSTRIALVVGMALMLCLSVNVAGAAPASTTNTVLVLPTDIGNSWQLDDTRAGGAVSIVNGPATPPLGTGSVNLTSTDQNGGSSQAKAQLVTQNYVGTALADITALSYSDYRSSASTNNAVQRIGLNIEVDFVGDGSSYTTLVFEPTYQPGGNDAMLDDTWQTWDAYNGGNAIWWSSKNIPGVCAFDCFVSWNDIIAANPNAQVIRNFGFSIGSGWAGVFDGNADALTIGVNGTTTVYDFERTPSPICRIWIRATGSQQCTFSNWGWLNNLIGSSHSGPWWSARFGSH